jgi:hypothetical protein
MFGQPTRSIEVNGVVFSPPVNVTFAQNVSGARTVFGLPVDNSNQNGGWKTLGAWSGH